MFSIPLYAFKRDERPDEDDASFWHQAAQAKRLSESQRDRLEQVRQLIGVVPNMEIGGNKLAERTAQLVKSPDIDVYEINRMIVYPDRTAFHWGLGPNVSPILIKDVLKEIHDPSNFEKFSNGERLPALDQLARETNLDKSPRIADITIIAPGSNIFVRPPENSRTVLLGELIASGFFLTQPSHDQIMKHYDNSDLYYLGMYSTSVSFFGLPSDGATGARAKNIGDAAAWMTLYVGDENSLVCRDRLLAERLVQAVTGKPISDFIDEAGLTQRDGVKPNYHSAPIETPRSP